MQSRNDPNLSSLRRHFWVQLRHPEEEAAVPHRREELSQPRPQAPLRGRPRLSAGVLLQRRPSESQPARAVERRGFDHQGGDGGRRLVGLGVSIDAGRVPFVRVSSVSSQESFSSAACVSFPSLALSRWSFWRVGFTVGPKRNHFLSF